MYLDRAVWQSQRRLEFLTTAPLGLLLPRSQLCHYAKDTLVCNGPQFAETAFLVLSGACELRHGLNGEQKVIETLSAGMAFGASEQVFPEQQLLSVVTTAETALLRIARAELERLQPERAQLAVVGNGDVSGNGHASVEEEQNLAARNDAPSGRLTPVIGAPALGDVHSLTFLSEELPASEISEELAKSLHRQAEEPVLLLRFRPQERAESAGDRGLVLNGAFRIPSTISKTDAGFHLLTLHVNAGPLAPQTIPSLLEQLTRHFRHVLIELKADEVIKPSLIEFLSNSSAGYFFVRACTEAAYRLDSVMHQLPAPAKDRLIRPIACLAPGEAIGDFDTLAQRLGAPIHMVVHGCPCLESPNNLRLATTPPCSFSGDLRRLARAMAGRTVGLALSSGAAKGFAHIGVIQVLEENGIEIDAVVGASMGAYVGSIWSYGYPGPELERLARELEGRWGLWSLIDPVFPPRQGFLRGVALKRRLMRSIGNARFGDLARPFRAVAGNLATLERVVFSSGDVATAIHASTAVPGICVPVTIDGETYIDGGVVDPLPVDVLREMGVHRIIAVDVIPTPERIRDGLKAERELAKHNGNGHHKLFRKVLPLDQQLNYFARGNLFEILMRSGQGAQIRVAEASCRLADLVLRPNIYDDRWADCSNPGKFIALGREVAERHLLEIQALVAGKTHKYEQKLPPEPLAAVA